MLIIPKLLLLTNKQLNDEIISKKDDEGSKLRVVGNSSSCVTDYCGRLRSMTTAMLTSAACVT